jgi:hypothetical protein
MVNMRLAGENDDIVGAFEVLKANCTSPKKDIYKKL